MQTFRKHLQGSLCGALYFFCKKLHNSLFQNDKPGKILSCDYSTQGPATEHIFHWSLACHNLDCITLV